MNDLNLIIYSSHFYFFFFLLSVLIFLLGFFLLVGALRKGVLANRTFLRQIFIVSVLLFPAIIIESWFQLEKSKTKSYIENHVVRTLDGIVSNGRCYLTPIEQNAMTHAKTSEDRPFFLTKTQIGISFGASEQTGCMIGVGFVIPSNRFFCQNVSDDGKPCAETPISYFWSEKQSGTANIGWSK